MSTINSQKDNSPIPPAVFKFQGQMYLLIAWLAITAMWLFMAFVTIESVHGQVSPGEVILLGSFFIIFLGGVITLRGKSDVVVNDQGISRRLFGWTWQTIRWDNIEKIKVIPFFNPALQKMVRIISIYPSVRPHFKLFSNGRIGFMDVAINMNELIEIINRYIAQHKIKIEATANDGRTSVTRL